MNQIEQVHGSYLCCNIGPDAQQQQQASPSSELTESTRLTGSRYSPILTEPLLRSIYNYKSLLYRVLGFECYAITVALRSPP